MFDRACTYHDNGLDVVTVEAERVLQVVASGLLRLRFREEGEHGVYHVGVHVVRVLAPLYVLVDDLVDELVEGGAR